MPTEHAWENCLDLSALPEDKRTQVTQALNWLEQHFPEFNEMIHEIQQGQRQGKLKKIRVSQNDYGNQFDKNDDTLALSFKTSIYLGIDNKLHEASLNETLVHELEHAVQKTRPGAEAAEKKIQSLRSFITPAYEALKNHLKLKGVTDELLLLDYVYFARDGDAATKARLDKTILDSPTFQKFSQIWLTAYKNYRDACLPTEDGAMDRSNILAQMLGKSPRGDYYDANMFEAKIDSIKHPFLVYTATPDAIRKRGHQSWPVPIETPRVPLQHGVPCILKGNLTHLQRDWNNKWNADTKNITSEEWRVIEEVKGNLLSSKILKTITPAEKKKIDGIMEDLKKNFNQSAENDALNEANKQNLTEKGLNGIAQKTSQKGWKL